MTTTDTTSFFAIPKKFDISGLKLPALAVVQVYERKLLLKKNLHGDFGFRIRRTNPTTDPNSMRIFADPIVIKSGPPRPNDILTNVLPGDELVEVNNVKVANLSREELQKIIEASGDELLIRVKTVPELAHLCGKSRKGIRDEGDTIRLSTDGIVPSDFDSIPEDSRYWLIHSEGYTVCQLMEHLPNNKMKIKVANTLMTVDRSDIERANPTTPNNDISKLVYVNLTSAIHLLRRLSGSGLTYSDAGALNLVALTPSEIEYTNETLIDLFKGSRRDQMPSHIFSTAQLLYRNLQSGARNQSVVFTGLTGSGKSQQLRTFVQYLCGAAGWTKSLTFKAFDAAITILDAFSNCRMPLNANASRCIRMYSLGFDTSAALCSANIKTFLLDTSRLFRSAKQDTYFLIFEYLWSDGDAELKQRLSLDSVAEQFDKYFTRQSDFTGEGTVKNNLKELFSAVEKLELPKSVLDSVFDVLGAILHLKQAQAVDVVASRSCFIRTSNAQIAANLLGVSVEDLSKAVFHGQLISTVPNIMNRSRMANRSETGPEALDSFIQAVYQEVFNVIVILVNSKLNKNYCNVINLLDIPGANFNYQWADFEREKISNFQDFIINYLNERLAELFYDKSFQEPMEVYSREQVKVDVALPLLKPHVLTRIIDRKPQLINSVNLEERSEEERGLLHLLQEEAMFPAGCDSSFLSRIFLHFEDNKLIRRHPEIPSSFILGHCHNTSPTAYNVDGWVREARSSHAWYTAPEFLKNSKKQNIQNLFNNSSSTTDVYKLRHLTQAVQQDSGPKIIGGFFNNIEAQLEYVLSIINRSSKVIFIHCIQPCPIGIHSLSDQTSLMNSKKMDGFDVPYVRSQLQSLLLIDSVRACNRGYPERLPFKDFRRRFQCLIQNHSNPINIQDALDDRGAVKKILETMDIDEHRYRLGISQILLRSDILVELEEKRDLQLSGLIESLQKQCRLHLSYKWLEKRRLQDMAIKCIQKNGLLYLNVKEWNWWKLYTKVKPLLGVAQQDEANREWRERVKKLEYVNNNLRGDCTKFENKIVELEQLLRASSQQSQALSLSLQHESDMRNRFEEELLAARQKLQKTDTNDRRRSITGSTTSLTATKVLTNEEWLNHPKTIELKTELEKLKENELSEQHKAKMATEQLEDVMTEITNLRQKNETLQKNAQNFQTVVDSKEEVIRNLEEQTRQLEQQLSTLKIHESTKNNEIKTLQSENTDLKSSLTKTKRYLKELEDDKQRGGTTEIDQEFLRKAKRELEEKMKKLEEELEEISNENQLLVQNNTRLEMESLKLKNEKKREVETRETEIADIRSSHQRQYRALEEEIESLTKVNQTLTAKCRQLESQGRQLNTHHQSAIDISSNRYKRDYKKVLALLRDSQAMLAAERSAVPVHSHLHQLKLQLEDIEAAKTNAIKEKINVENELNDLKCQFDVLMSSKKLIEDKNMTLLKERNNIRLLLEEQDEQFRELVKKFKAHVQQSQVDSITLTAQADTIAQLEETVKKLNNELATLSDDYQKHCAASIEIREYNKLLLKLRDMESKFSIETAQKQRAESQCETMKDEIETIQEELLAAKMEKDKEIEFSRKNQKERQELEALIKDLRRKLENTTEQLEKERLLTDQRDAEFRKINTDLKNATRRIEELQAALQADITNEDDYSESDDEAMGGDSIGDEEDHDESIGEFRPLRNSTPKESTKSIVT
uniref:Unconventional myosin-XVIIIa n=1 Tax=Panagrolaimus sp. JU765 TaxID=591449 RepID=A0AC34R191_9BILA